MTAALRILGTRGIPAAHGGFETFAERLALHLADQGWKIAVYCQQPGTGPITTDTWRGVARIFVPSLLDGAFGTMAFDWRAARHARRSGEPALVLGYNTALFNILHHPGISPLTFNMDGLEWQRDKWGPVAKSWLRANEALACRYADHLVADHPGIRAHLLTRVPENRVTMIPYGADAIASAPEAPIRALGLAPGRYLCVICRPEPENSLLEIVRGFSARPRNCRLLVLGDYRMNRAYHRQVMAQASDEVLFPGAIYDHAALEAIRFHSLGYVHGHRVGGTNPSLVEALGAGNPVIAHDNPFNRWVAADGALYFRDEPDFSLAVQRLIDDGELRRALQAAARARFQDAFTWARILGQYESLLAALAARHRGSKA